MTSIDLTKLHFVEVSGRHRGAITLVREESDQLFFVYTGAARGMMVNPLLFFGKTKLLERNVVIFQDRERAFYLRGITASLNSCDALLAWQRRFCASLTHVRRIFCLGTSMGAYAALLYGSLLQVEEVWAFGPMTRLPRRHALAGLDIPEERADLAVALSVEATRTSYNVYYNEGHEPDRVAAERISHCPGVRLWPQAGDDHNVVRTLLERDSLETLLPDSEHQKERR